MEHRVELIRERKEGESISALAEAYGVSRKTVYKWIERHAEEGTAGLADRSRAPLTSPHRLSEEMIARILETRQRWGWGPRKLLVKMAAACEETLPSASTVAELLRSKGLSHARQRRVAPDLFPQPLHHRQLSSWGCSIHKRRAAPPRQDGAVPPARGLARAHAGRAANPPPVIGSS